MSSAVSCCCTPCAALGVRFSEVPAGVDEAPEGVEEILDENLAACDWLVFSGDEDGVVFRNGDGEAEDSGRRKGELRGEANGAPPPLVLIWLTGRA